LLSERKLRSPIRVATAVFFLVGLQRIQEEQERDPAAADKRQLRRELASEVAFLSQPRYIAFARCRFPQQLRALEDLDLYVPATPGRWHKSQYDITAAAITTALTSNLTASVGPVGGAPAD